MRQAKCGAARPLAALVIVLAALVGDARADTLAEAIAAFEKAWKGEDYRAKVAAVERLIETGEAKALEVVVSRALLADDQFVFERTLEALREKTDPEDRKALAEQAHKNGNKDIRVVLTRLMGTLDTPAAVEAILASLKDREWTVRVAAIRAARERRAKELVRPLIAVVEAEDGRVRQDAIDALRDLTGASYGKDARQWLEWWTGVEAAFKMKPPLDATEVKGAASKDVETMSREGLYEVRSKRTLFIVDISGSMEAKTARGTRLKVVKEELKRVIQELAPDMLLNLLFFSDKAQLWKPRMTKASAEAKGTAIRLAEAQKAQGQTATYDALKLAFTLDDVDTIFFLSDGFPTAGPMTSEALIQTEVRKWNRTKQIAIHTIAFVAGDLKGENEDKARAKTFMQELAAENGGACKVVE